MYHTTRNREITRKFEAARVELDSTTQAARV
jgi:hypothetical protein